MPTSRAPGGASAPRSTLERVARARRRRWRARARASALRERARRARPRPRARARAASGRVSAPAPGPISRKRVVGARDRSRAAAARRRPAAGSAGRGGGASRQSSRRHSGDHGRPLLGPLLASGRAMGQPSARRVRRVRDGALHEDGRAGRRRRPRCPRRWRGSAIASPCSCRATRAIPFPPGRVRGLGARAAWTRVPSQRGLLPARARARASRSSSSSTRRSSTGRSPTARATATTPTTACASRSSRARRSSTSAAAASGPTCSTRTTGRPAWCPCT